MLEKIKTIGHWQGIIPPQYIFAHRQFKGIALDPPDFKPGSWIGAGNTIFNQETNEFILTARLRKAADNARGFAVNIYRSTDGENFDLVANVTKEEISTKCGLDIHSLEGVQLLQNPYSKRWHFYVSVNTDTEFTWGGKHWQTMLLTAAELQGPWQAEGLVLKNDQAYDAHHARDISIEIIDGRWFCLYKARDGNHQARPALATSQDGITWEKYGPLTIDGTERLGWVSGSMFAGSNGPLFIGLQKFEDETSGPNIVYADKHKIEHGAGPVRNFVAYNLDYRNRNLETIFRTPWEPGSKYEHQEQPLLGYLSMVYDPLKHRVLTYVEAIDGNLTKRMGINETIERLLVYETIL